MSRIIRLLLPIALLLITPHRLPAPIQEVPESPTPAPKPKVKAKSEEATQETKKKENKPTLSAFVGTWTGTIAGSMTSDVGLNVSSNASRTVIISGDGTVTYFGQSGTQTGPTSQSKVILSKDGRSVSWTNQQTVQNGSSRSTFSLQLISSNAANYHEDAVITSSYGNGRMKGSGVVLKR
ncbi:MAG TPA: hypothetical protein VN827_03480 [Chthoniobacterales bacterium]|jgi:hypothetical protein|nr:hypothetical protein [Chthoniobacterales bacterium]